jgi:hypothetical protein
MNYDGLLNQPAGVRLDHRHIPPIGRLLPWDIEIQDNALPDKALVQSEAMKLGGYRALYPEEFNDESGALRPGWGRDPEGWDRRAQVYEWIHEVLPRMPIGAPDIIYRVNTNAQHYIKDELFPNVRDEMRAQVWSATWERVNGVMRRTRLWKQLHWFAAELYVRPDVTSGIPNTSVPDACGNGWRRSAAGEATDGLTTENGPHANIHPPRHHSLDSPRRLEQRRQLHRIDRCWWRWCRGKHGRRRQRCGRWRRRRISQAHQPDLHP